MSGIWDNLQLAKFNVLPQKVRLSLGEGNTPIKLFEHPGGPIIAIKDENLNPNGSFKDRSVAYQMSMHVENGVRSFVISSSGNAGIAALAYGKLAGVAVRVYVGENVNPKKMAKMAALLGGDKNTISKDSPELKLEVLQTAQPKSDAFKFAQESGRLNLRGSNDDFAIAGFKTIAYELAEQYPKMDAVFVPCSSGTSAYAICLAFEEMGMKIPVYICQTQNVCPIASEFDPQTRIADASIADAIVDRVANRKPQLLEKLVSCGGGGFVIGNAELQETADKIAPYGFGFSYNSLLGFAGLLRNSVNCKHPVVIASGL